MSMFPCVFKGFDVLYIIINITVKEIEYKEIQRMKGDSNAKFNKK